MFHRSCCSSCIGSRPVDPELVYVSKVASSAWVKLGMVSSKAVSSAWIELGVVSSSGKGFAAPAAPAAAGALASLRCVGATTLEAVGASSAADADREDSSAGRCNAFGRNGEPPQWARWARSHSRE